MKTIEQTTEKLTISTSLVSAKVEIVERLHFGADVDDKWRAGEHQVIEELRSAKGITKALVKAADGAEHEMPHVDVYTDEAFAVVSAARAFFGDIRSLGPTAREKHPTGLLTMVLVPESKPAPVEAPELAEAPAGPPARRARGSS